jgi:hypothetical protein
MVWPGQWKSAIVITLVFLLLYPVVAKADVPLSYVTETVTSDYGTGGSLKSPVEMIGYIEVGIPNVQDVLQYIRLNLSSTQNTNLDSIVSYKNVAASPNMGDRTRIYVNTTQSDTSINYILSQSVSPVIFLGLDYMNLAGGQDIFSGGTNYFGFNLTINSTHDISGITLFLRFARNTIGNNDSINIYYTYASSEGEGFNSQAQDSDGDGFFDVVYWTGDLSAGEDVYIVFEGETTPGSNFNENLMYVDFDQGTTSRASYIDGTNTFTGIIFSDRFSRGPVREGVEIFGLNTWMVRGFITNMAAGIDYRIHGWDIYEVGGGAPLSSSNTEIYPFLPGQTEYTEWYDTAVPGNVEKIGYYSTAWNWETAWGPSSYSSISQATIELPVLYEINQWLDKSVVNLQSPSTSSVRLSVQDLTRHVGHSSLEVNRINLTSILPRQSLGNAVNTWTPSGISVLFINGSGQTDITSQASITTQSAGAADGFVNVEINDLSAIIGGGLRQNEDIRLEYTVTGSSHANTQTYEFCQTSHIETASGTPLSDMKCEFAVIPGTGTIEEEPGGGGAAGGVTIQPSLYSDIIRRAGEGYFIADNLVDVKAEYDIIDTGQSGVKNIRAVMYIPEYGSLYLSSVSFRIYDSSAGSWTEWKDNIDYTVNDNGITSIGDNRYREYIIAKTSSGGLVDEGLDLFNGDRIEISYKTTVPVGSTFVITRIVGYNYYEDKHLFEDMYIPLRREGVIQDLVAQEGVWQIEKVFVGTPVNWMKSITISNPNDVFVEHSMSFSVFDDTLSAYFIGENGREPLLLKSGDSTHVDYIVSIEPGESKTFVLEVTTPPLLETGRVVDILDSTDKEIVFMINTTIRNFALEDYPSVSFIFDSPEDKIIYVMEGNRYLNYSAYIDSSEIMLGDMGSGEDIYITIVYREVPPLLLTSMSSFMYGCADQANMTVFVIPSERESGAYLEIEVMGPDPQMNTINAQLLEIRDVWPWEEVKVPVNFDLAPMPDGKYIVNTKFKKSFQTILSDKIDFTVSCPEKTIVSIGWNVVLVISVALVGFLLYRTLKRVRKKDSLGALEKKLRDIK